MAEHGGVEKGGGEFGRFFTGLGLGGGGETRGGTPGDFLRRTGFSNLFLGAGWSL